MENTRFWVLVDPKCFDRSTSNLAWMIMSAIRPHMPKIVKIGLAGPPRHRGELSCSNVFFYFFLFLVTSCQALQSIATVFVSNDVVRWGLISQGGPNFNNKIFPHLNPQKRQFLDQFLDSENFRRKRFIMGRLISKLPLITTAAPWRLYSE